MSAQISIFVVNYNTRDLLRGCLHSVFENCGDSEITVFVADNNSDDGSAEMMGEVFPEVYVVRHRNNLGFTRAINRLLPMGQGEYFLILHPDMELTAGTLRSLVAFLEAHPKAGIVGGNLYYPDGSPNPCEILLPGFSSDLLCFAFRLFRKLREGVDLPPVHNPLEWDHKSAVRVNWVWNACMMVRRQVFEKIGFFDERFFVWYADWDLCRRAFEAGWSTHYVPSATAIHRERQSFSNAYMTRKEVRYKLDGWFSAPRQIEDRHVFLRKHVSWGSVLGAKIIYVLENSLRLLHVLGKVALGKSRPHETSYQLKACLETIQSIIKA
ncbi:MAG: glycosyltransferase family 2 protein [Thermodesulfobacteriota bacterium]|nr:glycosyltransferase family 2 protein [Thermodesulfobacteriota bacterium]